jgi:EAL domain-containing protein (putative c-di-GMP-specific phosphodiesterase class I)
MHAMKMRVVAEGVERMEQAALLKEVTPICTGTLDRP